MENLQIQQLALLGLVFFLVYELMCFTSTKVKGPVKRPPSPFSIPLLGHMHLLGKLPHISLLNLSKKYGGFMYLKFGTVDTLVVSSADAAREVLKVQDHVFASRPLIAAARYFGYGGAGLAWGPYGENWRNIRKLCTLELLTARRVESFQPFRGMEAQIFLADLLALAKQNSEVNLSTKLKEVTFNTMSRMLMNKSFSAGAASRQESEEALLFNETMTAGFAAAGSMHIGDFFPCLSWMDRQVREIKVLFKRLDDFVQKQLDEHRQNFNPGQPAKDFMDVIISAGNLSDASIKSLALDTIAAGTDTAAVTVEWAMSELMNHPAVMSKAQEELLDVVGPHRMIEEDDLNQLPYLQAIVKETLRLHPAAPLMLPHESTQTCEIWGFTFPAKTRLIVNVYAIARDESVWQNPSKFDPQRFLTSSIDVKGQHFELLPFGSGRRSCPGILLGLTSVKYILGTLLHAFDWKLPDDGPLTVDMSEEFGLTVTRATPLKLVPSPRLPAKTYT